MNDKQKKIIIAGLILLFIAWLLLPSQSPSRECTIEGTWYCSETTFDWFGRLFEKYVRIDIIDDEQGTITYWDEFMEPLTTEFSYFTEEGIDYILVPDWEMPFTYEFLNEDCDVLRLHLDYGEGSMGYWTLEYIGEETPCSTCG